MIEVRAKQIKRGERERAYGLGACCTVATAIKMRTVRWTHMQQLQLPRPAPCMCPLSLSLSHQYSTRVSNHISPTITIYMRRCKIYILDTHTRTPSYMQCKISLTVLLPLTRRERETHTPTAFTLLEKGDMNEQCAVCVSFANRASAASIPSCPPMLPSF